MSLPRLRPTGAQLRACVPALVRLPKRNFFDDKDGKPVAINHHIGRRPIMAIGNSGGDLHIRKLDRGLAEAGERGWLPVDMKNEWKAIYPAQ